MNELNLEKILNFADNLCQNNKLEDAYKYLFGIYEENKNHLQENELLELLLKIFEFHQQINPLQDLSFLFNKALEYSIKYNDNDSIFSLYKFYCMMLYKNAKLNKCEILIKNFISNFKDQANFQKLLKLKEIEISVNSILKEEIKNEDDFYDLMSEEMDPDQIIKLIVSYSRKFISTLDENSILKLLNILEMGYTHILKNRGHFKLFHYSFAELHNMLGNLYYYFGIYNRAKRHFLRAFMESLSKPDPNLFAKFQKNIAISLYELGEIDKANKYFSIIEKLYKKFEDPVVLNQFYSVLGLSYIRQGKYSLGHSLLRSAINYRMSIKDNITLLHTLNYAIIFSLFTDQQQSCQYFIYFEKIITQMPENIYYIFYILYQHIFKKKKFDSILFLKKLLKLPIYTLRLIPLFSFCLKYNLKLKEYPNFINIIALFKDNFKKEITPKKFENFKKQFPEYSEIYDLNIANNIKIKMNLPFKLFNDFYALDWDKIKDNDFINLNEQELIDLLYIKLLGEGKIVEYRRKKYRLRFEYKLNSETNIVKWAKNILFSRLTLKKIILEKI